MGYVLDPATVRKLAVLPSFPTFDDTSAAPVIDVSRARSALLVVTYTQGTNKGAATYPLVRVMVGTTATNLAALPIDSQGLDPVDHAGVGLEAGVRIALNAYLDAVAQTQAYVVKSFYAAKLASFQFAEINQGAAPGTLSAQLIVTLEH